MIDEAFQFAIDYCNKDLSSEETVKQGEIIIQAIYGRLTELKDKESMTALALGGVLKKLKHKDLWKQVSGVQSWWTWGDFCQQMAGSSLPTCYAKMRIWEKWQKVGQGHSPEILEELGSSISSVILRESNTQEDFQRLVDRYRELGSRDKLLEEIQGRDDAKPREERKEKRRYIKLGPTEKEFYKQTLEKGAEVMGKELYENTSEEEVLIFIMAQWRETAAN